MEFLYPTSNDHIIVDDILGYKSAYPHQASTTAASADDSLKVKYNAFVSTPNDITAYKQSLGATYKRSEGKYLRETLYFQSGLPISSSTTTLSFKAGDLASTYKVKAVVVSEFGVGFDESTFIISKPFDVVVTHPTVLAIGDTYQVTATITNYSPEDLLVEL